MITIDSMEKKTYRRWTGLILGGILGLIIGILSQTINHFLLPEIPFYAGPLGIFGNIAIITLTGIFIGLICSWMEPSIIGVLLSACIGAIIVLVIGLREGQLPIFMVPATILISLSLLVPLTGMLVMITAPFRIAVNLHTDYRREGFFYPTRWWLTIILLGTAVLSGYSTKLSTSDQQVVVNAHQLIQKGLAATTVDELPKPLQGNLVDNFFDNAVSQYSVQWTNLGIEKYTIPRYYSAEEDFSIVIFRFENRWILVCLYSNPDTQPGCKSFTILP
jgi:hypothetical protein